MCALDCPVTGQSRAYGSPFFFAAFPAHQLRTMLQSQSLLCLAHIGTNIEDECPLENHIIGPFNPRPPPPPPAQDIPDPRHHPPIRNGLIPQWVSKDNGAADKVWRHTATGREVSSFPLPQDLLLSHGQSLDRLENGEEEAGAMDDPILDRLDDGEEEAGATETAPEQEAGGTDALEGYSLLRTMTDVERAELHAVRAVVTQNRTMIQRQTKQRDRIVQERASSVVNVLKRVVQTDFKKICEARIKLRGSLSDPCLCIKRSDIRKAAVEKGLVFTSQMWTTVLQRLNCSFDGAWLCIEPILDQIVPLADHHRLSLIHI